MELRVQRAYGELGRRPPRRRHKVLRAQDGKDTQMYSQISPPLFQILTFASPTFRAMFEGEFLEKGQQEIPVNVPGTNAEHFEAFLQCLYPGGSEPKGLFQLCFRSHVRCKHPSWHRTILFSRVPPAAGDTRRLLQRQATD